MFGDTFFHAFNTTVDPSQGISAFSIIIEDLDDYGVSKTTTFNNIGHSYAIEDRAFVMNTASSVDEDGVTKVTAAVRCITRSHRNHEKVIRIKRSLHLRRQRFVMFQRYYRTQHLR
ncbi:hypothetical protein GYMLUDRAFT_717538 [Collybiopsis luxurians FD-317 M1]|nr:hypothetical protein GYMLUDRAFT_717538 [Collybiopsis luxurians FD-317 M1]